MACVKFWVPEYNRLAGESPEHSLMLSKPAELAALLA